MRYPVTALVTLAFGLIPASLSAQQPAYISANPYVGTPISEYDARVSPYSPYGARNQYTTDGGRIYGQDGRYLGRLNSNPYDPESVANPYGQYGSRYSPNSINNPYGQYGSEYSSLSARNPYASTPPVVLYRQPGQQMGTGYGTGAGTTVRTAVPRYCNRFLEECP